jgi:hypothetical protein
MNYHLCKLGNYIFFSRPDKIEYLGEEHQISPTRHQTCQNNLVMVNILPYISSSAKNLTYF